MAELTTAFASLTIVLICDFRPLTPLLEVTLGRFLTEFSRLVLSEQYAGLLLLPQPASAISVAGGYCRDRGADRGATHGTP